MQKPSFTVTDLLLSLFLSLKVRKDKELLEYEKGENYTEGSWEEKLSLGKGQNRLRWPHDKEFRERIFLFVILCSFNLLPRLSFGEIQTQTWAHWSSMVYSRSTQQSRYYGMNMVCFLWSSCWNQVPVTKCDNVGPDEIFKK